MLIFSVARGDVDSRGLKGTDIPTQRRREDEVWIGWACAL